MRINAICFGFICASLILLAVTALTAIYTYAKCQAIDAQNDKVAKAVVVIKGKL